MNCTQGAKAVAPPECAIKRLNNREAREGQRPRCPKNYKDRIMQSHQFYSRKRPIHLPNVERHNQPVILFVSVCTHVRKPVLADDKMHEVLKEVWRKSRQYLVGRYVIMPDHIHLFCAPAVRDSENVSSWAAFWKRLVSREFPELKPLWQRDCWDTQLRDANHYDEKWLYVRNNPVRKELVDDSDDWPYQGCMNELMW